MPLPTLVDPVSGVNVVDALAAVDLLHPGLRTQKVLNHGVVDLIDIMPRLIPAELAEPDAKMRCDYAVPQAARISYQQGTTKVSSDVGLIDNLIRNQHTSPVEMVELKWRLRLPIFVMRQHVRHRTASLNEESARYSELASDFYVPDPAHWARNTAADKQATVPHIDGNVPQWDFASWLYERIRKHDELSYHLYQLLLGERNEEAIKADVHKPKGEWSEDTIWDHLGVPAIAREQARMVLGVNIYTSCIWKIDLKNELHYLKLRADKHAQFEIRVYAAAMMEQLGVLCPAAMRSFADHFMKGVNLAESELAIYAYLLNTSAGSAIDASKKLGWTARRVQEFVRTKLTRMPGVSELVLKSYTDAFPLEKAS